MAFSSCGRRRILAAALLLAGLATTQFALGRKKEKLAALDEQKRALQALNRLSFGPRPGDLERVAQMGVDKWVDLQLHPEKIDDSAIGHRLAPFRTLQMNTREIVENFPNNEMIRQVAEGKMPMPRDPTRRAVYEAQVQRYEDKQDRKVEAAPSGSAADAGGTAADDAMLADTSFQRRREENQAASIRLLEFLDLPPDERFRAVLKLSPEEQRALASRAKGPKADALTQGMNGQEKETLGALKNPEQVVVDELTQAKLLRATYSERQLDEVMTDFWFNHFNVFINKGADRFLLTIY